MQKQIFRTVTTSQAKGAEPEITISTRALDRDGDEIVPEGCRLENYRRNPVVLFGHDQSSIPVGTSTHVEIIANRGIRARWRWLENDEFADRVRNAFDQGVLRAASVGFLPIERERNGKGGYRYTAWELIEFSLVPVPANPEAVRTLKALGLRGDDEIALPLLDDDNEHVAVSYQQVAEVLPNAIRGAFREVARGLQRERGRSDAGLPFSDPFIPRSHRRSSEPSNANEAEVIAACREIVPAVLREVVREAVQRALLLARGRVD